MEERRIQAIQWSRDPDQSSGDDQPKSGQDYACQSNTSASTRVFPGLAFGGVESLRKVLAHGLPPVLDPRDQPLPPLEDPTWGDDFDNALCQPMRYASPTDSNGYCRTKTVFLEKKSDKGIPRDYAEASEVEDVESSPENVGTGHGCHRPASHHGAN